MDIPCQVCGKPFPAKRASARYCGERCKKRAQRNPGRPANGTPVPVGGLAQVSPIRDSVGRVAAMTERKLLDAGRLDTVMGAVALALAAKVDEPGLDTGSSLAAVARELDRCLEKALEGVIVAETPLERQRRAREMKVG